MQGLKVNVLVTIDGKQEKGSWRIGSDRIWVDSLGESVNVADYDWVEEV